MKLGIMGFGHVGQAFAAGLVKTEALLPEEIGVSAGSEATLQKAEALGYQSFASNDELVRWSDAVIISLRGPVFLQIADSLDREAFSGKTVISFMAGVSGDAVREKLGEVHLVRAIPNIAVAKGCGVTGYTKAPPEIAELFRKVGYAFEVEEKDLGKVIVLASSGTGFAAYLLNAYQKAGEKLGFSAEESEKITAMTFQGALALLSFEETVEEVATKGGITERGVLTFEERNLAENLWEGLRDAYRKVMQG